MSHYQQTLLRIQHKNSRYIPVEKRFNVFKPMSEETRLFYLKNSCYDFREAFLNITLFCVLVLFFQFVLSLFHIPLLQINVQHLSTQEKHQVFFLYILPIVTISGFMVLTLRYFFQLSLHQSVLEQTEIDHIHQCLQEEQNLVPIVAQWMEQATPCYGDFLHLCLLKEKLEDATELDLKTTTTQHHKQKINEELRKGPLGSYLEQQHLEKQLPNTSKTSPNKRL